MEVKTYTLKYAFLKIDFDVEMDVERKDV